MLTPAVKALKKLNQYIKKNYVVDSDIQALKKIIGILFAIKTKQVESNETKTPRIKLKKLQPSHA